MVTDGNRAAVRHPHQESTFVIEYFIIGVCLYLDLLDLILHMFGPPYPSYARDYHRLGINLFDDKRMEQPVTMFSIFSW